MTQDRILVIQTAFLGDAVLTLPLLQVIAEQNPRAEIDVLCIEASKSIFDLSPVVKNVMLLDKRGKHKSISSLVLLALQLNKNKYSKVIAPHRSLRTSILVLFLQADEKIGFKNAALSFVYNKKVKYFYEKHEIDRNIALVEANRTTRMLPIMNYDDEVVESINFEIDKLTSSKRYIILAPGSQWETKRYPIEKFRLVAQSFTKQGFIVLVIGSKAEYNLCSEITDEKMSLNLAGKYDISLIPLIMKRAELVITNDSSPTHLALVAGTKCLTIYCSTIPEFGFGAYNEMSRFIQLDDLWCKPCGIHGYKKCITGKYECGNLLKPEIVISAGNEFINE